MSEGTTFEQRKGKDGFDKKWQANKTCYMCKKKGHHSTHSPNVKDSEMSKDNDDISVASNAKSIRKMAKDLKKMKKSIKNLEHKTAKNIATIKGGSDDRDFTKSSSSSIVTGSGSWD